MDRTLTCLLAFLTVMLVFLGGTSMGEAAAVGAGKKILFIPLDNRPITDRNTRDVATKLGFEVVTPPDSLLGTREHNGDPEKLWQWLGENARGADAAVISTDAMIYGSLVGSRNHDLDQKTILERVNRFQGFHESHPRLPVYAFGTILRTLLSATHSGGMEPAEYEKHAVSIYRYSILRDKIDMGMRSRKETREYERLEQEIPQRVLGDWKHRHQLNYSANEALVDLAGKDVFSFLFLGGDDSAPLSQTHYESRHLKEYGKDLGKTRFQVISGADELAMVMLCRAINDRMGDIPFVYTAYNEGMGRNTIPKYCNEKIGDDVEATIVAAGGMSVPTPERAEMVFAINTNPDGKTGEANSPSNTLRPRKGTKHFTSMVKDLVEKGYAVGVGDITYANGADNALMEQFRKEGLQFRIRAYGGWNTATNSTGFLIGTGLLNKWMDKRAAEELMLTRYLDDWAYQANVRTRLSNELWNLPGEGDGANLGGKRAAADEQTKEWILAFAKENIQLPEGLSLSSLRITHPWNRLFECGIEF